MLNLPTCTAVWEPAGIAVWGPVGTLAWEPVDTAVLGLSGIAVVAPRNIAVVALSGTAVLILARKPFLNGLYVKKFTFLTFLTWRVVGEQFCLQEGGELLQVADCGAHGDQLNF